MHKLTLSTGAARWLFIYLNQPGLFKTVAHVHSMGKFCEEHLPSVEKAPDGLEKPENLDKFKEWMTIPFRELEITETQRDTIKLGLNELARSGGLNIQKWTLELLTAFGLTA